MLVCLYLSLYCCFCDAPFCRGDAAKISISYIRFCPLGGILVIFGLEVLQYE
jgi:hypothetical protein